jgi:hypothetical protein
MLRTFARSAALVSGVLAAATLVAVPAASASPSSTTSGTAKVDCITYDPSTGLCSLQGSVYALVQVGDRTYIGGTFNSVSGVARRNVAALRADGTLDPTWNPDTDGVVYALAASSDGSKIFLGGGFNTVGGQPRSRLAAVTPDTGALVEGWTTTVKNNFVRALVADSADRLYVGGSFTTIGGKAIPQLAALSQMTGAVEPTTTFSVAPGGTVRALALSEDETRLYAGGPFTTFDGLPRRGAAEMIAANGDVTAFNPSESGAVISMDVSPGGRLFFGTQSNRTYAYDPATGSNVPVYTVRSSGDVQAILATNDEVYIGGHFSGFPDVKISRLHIASFSTANGQLTSWDPGANGTYGVWAIGLTRTALSPTAAPALLIGGDFTRVAGAARRSIARFSF